MYLSSKDVNYLHVLKGKRFIIEKDWCMSQSRLHLRIYFKNIISLKTYLQPTKTENILHKGMNCRYYGRL